MIAAVKTIELKPGVIYPESDGDPLAESDLHAQETIALFLILKQFFVDHADVYVAADNFIYYEEGNPSGCVSPDVYVVKGVGKHLRDTFKTWEEGGRTPDVVFEITSKNSRRVDFGKKKLQYQQLGVAEYFLFDPRAEYLKPALQGFRLEGSSFVPIAPHEDGVVPSDALKLDFAIDDDGLLRVCARGSNVELPRAEKLSESLNRAEADITRLKEELNHLRK